MGQADLCQDAFGTHFSKRDVCTTRYHASAIDTPPTGDVESPPPGVGRGKRVPPSIIILSTFLKKVNKRAVPVNSRTGRHRLPVVHDPLRCGDAFETRVWCCWRTSTGEVTTHNQNPLAPIRVKDTQDCEPATIIG